MENSSCDNTYECKKCDKSFCSKYSLDRHVKTRHSKGKQKREEDSSDNEEAKEEEPSDYVWRQMMKYILQEWNGEEDGEMPQNEEEFLNIKKEIRSKLYDQTVKILNDYAALIESPLYKKIRRSEKRIEKIVGDSDSEDEGEAFQSAFEQRKILLNKFIEDNADVVERYNESTDGEEETDEDNEKEDFDYE